MSYILLFLNIILLVSNAFISGKVVNLSDSIDDKLIEMQFLLDKVIQLDSAFIDVKD